MILVKYLVSRQIDRNYLKNFPQAKMFPEMKKAKIDEIFRKKTKNL